jgi:tripartite-type tricarboxylate transporter receptor subunit TctC/ABC-type uncharacterized transport system substrate-binding protein
LGQTFVVENRPGAAGNIGTEAVARSSPDGHTLLLATCINTINTSVYEHLSFDFVRDLVPVARIAYTPLIVVVHPAIPVRTIPELVAYAKANPGKLNLGTAGVGSPIHVAGELFKIRTNTDMFQVHYRGGAPAVVDLLGGQVQIMFDVLSECIEYVRAGRLRALAVTSAMPSDAVPNIPTVADFLPGFEATFWTGVCAPKGTPSEIIAKLNAEINRAISDPVIKLRFAELGSTVFTPGSSAEFGKFIADETEKWTKVVRAAGIKTATPAIGYLSAGSAASDERMLAALRNGLREGGYVEGKNLAFEYRFADGQYDRLPALAKDLDRGKVDVIVTVNASAAMSVQLAVATIPIVFNADGDPVQLGLVGSLNRPAGNLTGVTSFAGALASKQLGLLRDLVPKARLIAVLANPDDPFSEFNNSSAEEAARSVGQRLIFLKARTEEEIDAAFEGIIRQRADALIVTASPLFRIRVDQLIALAATRAVPTLYFERGFADAGGLMSYGTNLAEAYSRMGIYAATILNGAKPADLPVVQATKFEFVINMQTARTLGIEVPPGVLAIADAVIE